MRIDSCGGSLTCSARPNIGTPSVGLLVSSGSATFNGGLTMDLGQQRKLGDQRHGGSLMASSMAWGRTALSFTAQLQPVQPFRDLCQRPTANVNITGNLNMGTASAANSASTPALTRQPDRGRRADDRLNNGGRWSVVDVWWHSAGSQ